MIYLAHSNAMNFQETLYQPIQQSPLYPSYSWVLPHEKGSRPYPSKSLFQSGKCCLVIAEASYPSTGMGIELGWADILGIPIIGIYEEGKKPSSSVSVVAKQMRGYHDKVSLLSLLQQIIEEEGLSPY